jgi:hypothetical protein
VVIATAPIAGSSYTGCHKYVPFARFTNERHDGVQQFEIIIKDDNRAYCFY